MLLGVLAFAVGIVPAKATGYIMAYHAQEGDLLDAYGYFVP